MTTLGTFNPEPTGLPTRKPRAREGLVFSSLLAVALLLVSFTRLAGDVSSPAFDMRVVSSALNEPLWRTRMGLNIALFVIALLALHLAVGAACWLLALLGERAFPASRVTRRQWVLVWFLPVCVWLLVANATWFPNSSLGSPYATLAATRLWGISPITLATTCLAGCLAAVALRAAMNSPTVRRRLGVSAGIAAVLMATAFIGGQPATLPSGSKPHIVILGIDSLRPDAVNHTATPHIHDALRGGSRLTDAITPLARTFPSWVSILTGRHPHTTGAYINLLPRELMQTGKLLPEILRENGYRTYYAIDETRFSNIDSTYGFDRTVMPTPGASDFVLSWFADTPLSNLAMNTPLGELLFPHVHANRAAHVVYDPDTFVQRIGDALDADQPVFLAAHLTLPHWPFTWASSAPATHDSAALRGRYQAAIRRADQQYGDLLGVLQRKGILRNAIVVTLSDHGEALGGEDDLVASTMDHPHSMAEGERWGHGTSVLSPNQYRVVFGLRGYGEASALLPAPQDIPAPVSLLDLTPTLLSLLQIDASQQAFDGQSLAPLLRDPQLAGYSARIRFTESEYNPQGFNPHSMTPSATAEAARIYRLDPATDRIEVREDKLEWIRSHRQYAALLGNHTLVAALPGLREDGKHALITAELRAPSLIAGTNDLSQVRDALAQRFGIDIATPEKSSR